MNDAKKYRVKVSPSEAAGRIATIGNVFYGVSIGAPGRSIKDLVSGYRWAAGQFPRCAILLGDGLFRITLRIREGLDEEQARAVAGKTGDDVLYEFGTILGHDLPEILRSSAVIGDADFEDAFERIRHFYRTDEEFASTVDSDAHEFVNRQKRNDRLGISCSEALRLSVRYVLEEVAVYLVLAERGWLVDVYLGRELPALAVVSNSPLKSAPVALAKRVNVSIRPR